MKIDLIGFPACGTTSFFRRLVSIGHQVTYHDGFTCTDIGIKYENNVFLIARKSEKEFRESCLRRKKTIPDYFDYYGRLTYWSEIGTIFYLDNFKNDKTFPKLNQFEDGNLRKLVLKKRIADLESELIQL